MSEIRHQGRILEAIDQLRRRKARPDVDRICNFLSRRFSVDSQDTRADLQKLVDAEIVIKVEYKGNTSYRNAAKWSRYPMYKKQDNSLQSNSETSSLLKSTIAELIVREPDYLDIGVPLVELEKYLQENDAIRFSKKSLDVILQKEVLSGNIARLKNGNYSLTDHPIPTNTSTSENLNNELTVMKFANSTAEDINGKIKKITTSKIQTPENTPPPNTTGFRVGIRTKKAKKVFDPSDNNIPARKRGRPLGSTNKPKQENLLKNGLEPGPSCCICHHHNKRGIYEKLVACKDCTSRAHPSCIEATDIHSKVTNWLCQNCKTCCSCFEPAESLPMVVCSGCDDYYHVSCSNATRAEVHSNSHWLCTKCTAENKLTLSCSLISPRSSPNNNEINGSDSIFSSSKSLIKEEETDEEDNIDDSIPDVSLWSTDQIYQYFLSQGYSEGGKALRENDIDGHSLLLLKRNDVLIGLNLKLGPALKFYGQIKKLQIRRNDKQLIWA